MKIGVFKTIGLAVVLVCLAPGIQAGISSVGQDEVVSESVTLMVKREVSDGSYPWRRLDVAASEVDARMRELLEDPSVLAVERAGRVGRPTPKIGESDTFQQMAVESEAGPLYNDTYYHHQDYFVEGDPYNSQFQPAHRRLTFPNAVRVGVVDGDFSSSVDLEYAGGANFVAPRGSEFRNGQGGNCASEQGAHEHGVLVAHLIGATTNNTLGIASVAQNVAIVAARVLGCGEGASAADAVDAMLWLSGESVSGVDPIDEPVDVINLSLGGRGTCPGFVQDAVDLITSKGITIVAGAGNDGADADSFAPANCLNVLSVAASDRRGEVSFFSNTGSTVNITAQGEFLASAVNDGSSRFVDGTSFSSPIVAGAIAMVKSERPETTPAQFASYISQSGKPLSVAAEGVGAGILDAMMLLDAAGVPRERFGIESALAGERERYADALVHPNVTAYLSGAGQPGACDLVQVDSSPLDLSTSNDPLTVFGVPKGHPLSPTADNATIIATSDEESLIVDKSAFQSNMDYGYARCDVDAGSNCNQVDTIRGLDVESLTVPTQCTVLAANR